MLATEITLGRLRELVPHLTCIEVILERASSTIQEDEGAASSVALNSISKAIKSQSFAGTHHLSKRDLMKDIVGTYSKVFGTKKKKKKEKKKQPVVFLPKPKGGKDCDPSNRMSSFGYLSFVLSLINAAVNAANNINNNQNNNNNNNNNINDNNNNINIANSNLNQNNDNAVTAGRRRRKFENQEKIRKMLAAHVLNSATTSRQKRQTASEASEVYQQCLLASFMFMDFWQRLQKGQDLKRRELCALQATLLKIGPWAVLIGRPLALGIAEAAKLSAKGQSKADMWRLLSKSQLKCE